MQSKVVDPEVVLWVFFLCIQSRISKSVYSSIQMNTGFDSSIIDQLLTSPEQKQEEDELEIKRKYYKKPDMQTDPLQAANFLRNFVQGM